MKNVICPEERLLITLRYLATGDEILSIALQHRIGRSTAHNIIYETCNAIDQALSPIYLKPPVKQVWKNIANGFSNDWNLPNCIGAVDGRHMVIRAPPHSGSMYFSYKKTNSIVLLASCNHRYEFNIIDIGAYGSESDGGILARSEFGRKLKDGDLDIPEDCKLPNTDIDIPFYFVGDEAFALKKNFMQPFPGRNLERKKRIFNYRLSRARRCIENAFGILVSRWRVFEKPLAVDVHQANNIIKATVCLHNFLMGQTQESVRNLYVSEDLNGSSDLDLRDLSTSNNNQRSKKNHEGRAIRDLLADYFMSSDGAVPWQDSAIDKGLLRHV